MNVLVGKRRRFILLAVLLVSATACTNQPNLNQSLTTTTPNGSTSTVLSAAEASKRNNALVRVVHATPGAAAIDVSAGDSKIFSNINYKTISPYIELVANRHTFTVRPAGFNTATPIDQNSETFAKGRHYTIFVMAGKDQQAAAVKVIDDDFPAPTSGKAAVRVFHALSDAGAVDVFAQGRDSNLFENLTFQAASSYETVNPMTTTLEVRPREGERTALLTIPDVRVEAGAIYTMIVTGKTKSTPVNTDYIIIEDRFGDAVPSTTSPSSNTSPAASPTATATP